MAQVRRVYFSLEANCRIASFDTLRMLLCRWDSKVEPPRKLILTYSCARHRRML